MTQSTNELLALGEEGIRNLPADEHTDELIAIHVLHWHQEPDTGYGHTVAEAIATGRLYWADEQDEYMAASLDWDYQFSVDMAAAYNIWQHFTADMVAVARYPSAPEEARYQAFLVYPEPSLCQLVMLAPSAPLALCRLALLWAYEQMIHPDKKE